MSSYFDDRTYENLMKEYLAYGEERGIDTREGSIFYDAGAAACFKIAKYYADLRDSFELLFITSATGHFLDLRGEEFNVFRNQATTALYEFVYEGTPPQMRQRFFTDGMYFVINTLDNALVLAAEEAGAAYNNILPGTPAIPTQSVAGLKAASFGALIEPGADTEDNEPYRKRIQEKVAGPAQNGNRQHYKTWCESVDGVGRARIIPLFAGENTVMGVLIGADGYPAAETLVERVQEYIDPITEFREAQYNGKTVIMGDGLGNGVANIGAHFAAVSAEPVVINIEFTVTLRSSHTAEQVQEEAENAIKEILIDIALNTPESEDMVVRMSTIGASLFSLQSVLDYTGLMLNGKAANIEIARAQIAVLGEVLIHVV